MQTPCASRDRLGKGQFWEACDNNAVGIQEQTFKDILAAEPLYDKVCKAAGKRLPFMWLDKVAAEGKALGVLSDAEVALLERAEIGRMKSINVDDFDPAELKAQSLEPENREEQAA